MEDERLSASWALSSLVLGSTIAYSGTDHSKPVWDGNSEKIRKWFDLPHRQAWWEHCDVQYEPVAGMGEIARRT
jgi:hypothetical protein